MRHPQKTSDLTRLASLAAAILSVMFVAACGRSSMASVSAIRVEHAVENTIAQQRGLRTTVACPSRIPQRAGYVFTCNAQLDAGAYPVMVAETDDLGHVRYENPGPLSTLNIAKVQQAIWLSIFRQRSLRSTVTCPAEVLQHAGVTFTCTAVINGEGYRYPFAVRELDNTGHVQYVGLRHE
jgi:hypothetical protein